MTQPIANLPLAASADSATETHTEPQASPDGIPAETWALLRSAGHTAAERLDTMLKSSSFNRLKASDQARLVELALNRAYGPPVKREMSLTLSGDVSDAVATSLARLSSVDLPEIAPKRSR